MAKNQFLPWMPNGDQGEDNILSQEEYELSPIRRDGVLWGTIADAKTYNKALQQLSIMVSALGGYIASTGNDALDSDSMTSLMEKILKSITSTAKDIQKAVTWKMEIDDNGDLIATLYEEV